MILLLFSAIGLSSLSIVRIVQGEDKYRVVVALESASLGIYCFSLAMPVILYKHRNDSPRRGSDPENAPQPGRPQNQSIPFHQKMTAATIITNQACEIVLKRY